MFTGQGKVLYKVRAHDEEIINLSWCPQYEVEVKKALKEVITGLAGRLERIRNTPEENEIVDCENNATAFNKSPKPEKDTTELSEKSQKQTESVQEEVVQEDDMFDIYKDHEADEFGHKKYQPEDIYVKVKTDEVPSDFLAECLKLKGDILKLKAEPEPSIEALVDALDNTQLNDEKTEASDTEKAEGGTAEKSEGSTGEKTAEKAECSTAEKDEGRTDEKTESSAPEKNEGSTSEKGDGDGVQKEKAEIVDNPCSVHIHRHLLATIGKHGYVL